MFNEFRNLVMAEIGTVLKGVSDNEPAELVQTILQAKCIVTCGSGRVGLACKGFAMRLGHLGLTAYTAGDSTLPRLSKDNLLIAGSSSGETLTVYDMAMAGKTNGARVVVITAEQNSRMAKLADTAIVFNAPTKFSPRDLNTSIQPMATLFEQSLQAFFDIIILMLMKETSQTHDDMWARHSNLE